MIFNQYIEDKKEFSDVLLSFRKKVEIDSYDDIHLSNIKIDIPSEIYFQDVHH